MPKSKSSDLWVRNLILLVIAVFTFLPSEIVFGLYFLIGPTDFWQKFAILGLGLVVTFSIQIAFLIIGLIAFFSFLKEW